MPHRIFFLAVVSALLYATESSHGRRKGGKTDIKEFVNTNDIIWTYNTTAHKRLPCLMDFKKEVTEKDIQFERHHFTRQKRWAAKHLIGKFGIWSPEDKNKSKPYDYMEVLTFSQRKWVDAEILEYQHEDNTCGVFTVMSGNGIPPTFSHELRVKNSSIQTGPKEECKKQFLKVVGEGKKIKGAYDHRCHKALKYYNENFLHLP
uniref:Putative lipocalin-3 1 n=1 Tax=Amblyomma cajennense TaxID=34607 RepID=A0A023FQT9_AMBCJ